MIYNRLVFDDNWYLLSKVEARNHCCSHRWDDKLIGSLKIHLNCLQISHTLKCFPSKLVSPPNETIISRTLKCSIFVIIRIHLYELLIYNYSFFNFKSLTTKYVFLIKKKKVCSVLDWPKVQNFHYIGLEHPYSYVLRSNPTNLGSSSYRKSPQHLDQVSLEPALMSTVRNDLLPTVQRL